MMYGDASIEHPWCWETRVSRNAIYIWSLLFLHSGELSSCRGGCSAGRGGLMILARLVSSIWRGTCFAHFISSYSWMYCIISKYPAYKYSNLTIRTDGLLKWRKFVYVPNIFVRNKAKNIGCFWLSELWIPNFKKRQNIWFTASVNLATRL